MISTTLQKTAVALCFLFILGCGKSSGRGGGEPLYSVTGTVTYQGKPVTDADILFSNAEGTLSSFGRTDANGNFKMTTYSPNDGVPAGPKLVAISKAETETVPNAPTESPEYIPPSANAPSNSVAPAKSSLPIKYAKKESSGLKINIKPDNTNKIDLQLTD